MKKINFIFGIHNHQPVGNFPEVLEMAYRDAYSPFIKAMARHPKIKWSLHCSGILWDFMVEKHPEYMAKVRNMVNSGQLELLTGGYYEPIISVIPDADKRGQILKLTSFLKDQFGYDAKGMWLAERVWEPQLAKVLADAGVKYSVVDDAHFAASGLDVEKLSGYYVTEDQGTKLNIFPINQLLRYYIPFNTVEKTIEYMASAAREGGFPALVMADDGEKFGLWPETNKHVYGDRWLENFLTAIDNNLSWIEPVTFSEYLKKAPPEGRVYLSATSYFEMSEWSLSDSAQEVFGNAVKEFDSRNEIKRFLHGGFWRNFLTKYEESNNMHKKMLYVSEKIQKLKDSIGKDRKSGNNTVSFEEKEIERAQDALYAGQCNCAFWHGVFGGLYLPHLRTAVYQKLIEAETIANKISPESPHWKEFDFDRDGVDEILFEGDTQNIYISPKNGGAIFEWDIFLKNINILNVLTRRREAYHKKLRESICSKNESDCGVQPINDIVKVKEDNLDSYLNYDWYRRSSIIDHFIHPETKYDDFKKGQFGEQGDFVLGNYSSEISGEKLVLRRNGSVWTNQSSVRISVQKEIQPINSGVRIVYKIQNMEESDISLVFAPEFNFAFSYPIEGESGLLSGISEWTRRDEGFGFNMKMSFLSLDELWIFPLETVSQSEGGFERTYQGTVVLALKKIQLGALESIETEIVVDFNEL